MTTETTSRRLASDLPTRLSLPALFHHWIRRGMHGRQTRQLSRLDDYLLRDIGLTRDDLRRRH